MAAICDRGDLDWEEGELLHCLGRILTCKGIYAYGVSVLISAIFVLADT